MGHVWHVTHVCAYTQGSETGNLSVRLAGWDTQICLDTEQLGDAELIRSNTSLLFFSFLCSPSSEQKNAAVCWVSTCTRARMQLSRRTPAQQKPSIYTSAFFLKRSSVEFMQKFLSWSGIKHLTVRCPYSSDMCNREDYILPEQNHLYVGYRISEQCGLTLL